MTNVKVAFVFCFCFLFFNLFADCKTKKTTDRGYFRVGRFNIKQGERAGSRRRSARGCCFELIAAGDATPHFLAAQPQRTGHQQWRFATTVVSAPGPRTEMSARLQDSQPC